MRLLRCAREQGQLGSALPQLKNLFPPLAFFEVGPVSCVPVFNLLTGGAGLGPGFQPPLRVQAGIFLGFAPVHSSILAWKISWTEEPGGLQSMGSQRVRHD